MNGPLESTVVWLTMRQLFARRRLSLAVAFSFVPLVATMFFKIVAEDRPGGGLSFLTGLNRELIIGTLVPLAAAVFGTTAFGCEVDDGTLVYLLVQPIARWRIVLSKYIVAVLSTIAVMVPAMVLPWLVVRDTGASSDLFRGFFVGGALAAAIYCALFLSLGLASRRALLLSLLYVIGFEAVLSRNLQGVKSLSVREFAIAASREASNGTLVIKEFVVPMSTVYTMSAIMFVGALALALWKLFRYELAERL